MQVCGKDSILLVMFFFKEQFLNIFFWQKCQSFCSSHTHIKIYRDINDNYIYTVCSIFIKNTRDVLQLFCY